MADITEALERLASLRDRGVLTPDEFDRQKAALLDPPAPAAVPPPSPVPSYAPPVYPASRGGSDKTLLYVGGGIAALVIVVALLWVTGVLAKVGLVRSPAELSSSTASINPQFGGATGSATNPPAGPASAPTSGYATPYAGAAGANPPAGAAGANPLAGAAGANPLIGEWESADRSKTNCPQRIVFTSTYLMIEGGRSGTTETRRVNVVYNVISPLAVNVTAQDGENHTVSASVLGSRMEMEHCTFVNTNANN